MGQAANSGTVPASPVCTAGGLSRSYGVYHGTERIVGAVSRSFPTAYFSVALWCRCRPEDRHFFSSHPAVARRDNGHAGDHWEDTGRGQANGERLQARGEQSRDVKTSREDPSRTNEKRGRRKQDED